MKYSELISFNPIEDVIQLTSADDPDRAREYVKTYVMSDRMAENMQAPVIDQLQMDEVVDNHGILIVGNYGTGKSHLMSMISACASDANNLQYLQNRKFAEAIKPVAGMFEVLRIEIGGVTMSLREILLGFIQEDLNKRGINFDMPDLSQVRDNKKLIKDIMVAFAAKYANKGYLIVVDEFLSYLTSRNERQIVLDLEFLRALGEMCSTSRIRVIFGVQEKIFDNPKFSFVSDTLRHVSDRFTQLIITKESTAYVVSERILKKTPAQKALIRKHLEKFSQLYTGMSSRMEEFVNLFPIHPSYIDVFNKIYLIENRHILKNISICIKNIFDTQVPYDAPGIFSFDDYWSAIKSNGLIRSDVTINRVVNASGQLEDIINRVYPDKATKPMAIQIIYALSVHRLTTNGLDVKFGLTAENLKDELCLFTIMPEYDADFLLGVVKSVLRKIMSTVFGQFIIHNNDNDQYYIDVDKVIDYDEKISQKASIMAASELNNYFYDIVYSCLEWDEKQYVSGFNIYQYDINWVSHNIFREGYLFMGLPGERSTAQPERDFYIHIMPLYEAGEVSVENLNDEVYLYFKSTDEFENMFKKFSASQALARISDGRDKDTYLSKGKVQRKQLIKYLSENKNNCFEVVYKKQRHKIMEVLKGHYKPDMTFKDTIDTVASITLDEYFDSIYPEFPIMKIKLTRKNRADSVRAAFDYFAGRKTQQATAMLQSFGLLDEEKIKPERSKYARYFIDKVKSLPPQGVLNFSDLFDDGDMDECFDKKYRISFIYTPIIFLSLVYAGLIVITLKNNTIITASNLDRIPKISVLDLYEFRYISRPAQISMAELKKMFEILDINPALLNNSNDLEKGVIELVKKARDLSNLAVTMNHRITDDFTLWGEPLANAMNIASMKNACKAVSDEFSNYSAKYNTPAKLNNFSLSMESVEKLAEQISTIRKIDEYVSFKNECGSLVGYLSNIEYINLGDDFKNQVVNAKTFFREVRDSIMDGVCGDDAAHRVETELIKVKDKYICIYFDEHRKKRLDIKDARRRGFIQESLKLANLKKLRTIEIVSSSKLSAIENDLSSFQVCYELTSEELKSTHICPHCRFNISDNVKNVFGQLENIEKRIDKLITEWTQTLLDTVSDPIVASQKKYLNPQQKAVIENFISSGRFPERVDDYFVNSFKTLLHGFEPVVIEAEDIADKLSELGSCDVATFKQKFSSIVDTYTKGKDMAKLRIIVKKD